MPGPGPNSKPLSSHHCAIALVITRVQREQLTAEAKSKGMSVSALVREKCGLFLAETRGRKYRGGPKKQLSGAQKKKKYGTPESRARARQLSLEALVTAAPSSAPSIVDAPAESQASTAKRSA